MPSWFVEVTGQDQGVLSELPIFRLIQAYPGDTQQMLFGLLQAVPSWFVEVTKIKERLLANNAQTYWVPSYVKDKRFHNWLADAHDWAVSRSRCPSLYLLCNSSMCSTLRVMIPEYSPCHGTCVLFNCWLADVLAWAVSCGRHTPPTLP